MERSTLPPAHQLLPLDYFYIYRDRCFSGEKPETLLLLFPMQKKPDLNEAELNQVFFWARDMELYNCAKITANGRDNFRICKCTSRESEIETAAILHWVREKKDREERRRSVVQQLKYQAAGKTAYLNCYTTSDQPLSSARNQTWSIAACKNVSCVLKIWYYVSPLQY